LKARLANSADPIGEVRTILNRLAVGVEQDLAALPHRAADRVHDIRVRMKKFRAILLMLSGGLAARTFLRADRMARKLKDYFSSTRDDEMLRELVFDLLDESEADSLTRELGLPPAASDPVGADAAIRATGRELGVMVETLRVHGDCRSLLFEGWITTYRAAKKCMKLSAKDGDDFVFHEWRKRIKELLYQSSVLADTPAAAEIIPGAENLASVLGKHHDLALLSQKFDEKLPGHRAAKSVRQKKSSLAQRALHLGSQLLVDKPSTLRRKLLAIR